MAKLKWGVVAKKTYETGIDRGVLFLMGGDGAYSPGVAWSGLTAVNQSPDGAEETPLYADNQKYLSLLSAENFKGSIGALSYPSEFNACEGSAMIAKGIYASQQDHQPFGFAYRTLLGNDTLKNAYGYKIHLVYQATAAPSERNNETINESPSAVNFSWDFTTTPVTPEASLKLNPTAHLVIDSTEISAAQLKTLEDLIYGTADEEAKLPTIEEVLAIVKLP